MFRWLLSCLVLCGLAVGLVGWFSGAWTHNHFLDAGQPGRVDGPAPTTAAAPPVARVIGQGGKVAGPRTLAIPDGRLLVVDRQEVPAQAEGQLLFIGTEMKPGELVAPERKVEQMIYYPALLADPMVPQHLVEMVPVEGGGMKPYRRWVPDALLKPLETTVLKKPGQFRKLAIGEYVHKGDLIALVNPELATDELAIAITHFDASHFDHTGSIKVRDEYLSRYNRNLELRATGGVGAEELSASRLAYEKYVEEVRAKEQAKRKAEREVNASITKLHQHQIRAGISGYIKMIYKNNGDAVRRLEPVVQILNMDKMRVEALVGVEQMQHIKKGMKAVVEASRPDTPANILPGHQHEVTCVAVSNTNPAVIVSGSEDRMVRGWDAANNGSPLWELGPFATTVRAIACPPRGAGHSLAVIAVADGSVWVFNLADPKSAPTAMPERHKGPVHAIAYSPDGKVCATAGEDRSIALWDVGARKRLQTIPGAHRAALTSITYVGPDQLVTAARDNTEVAWRVEIGKAPVRGVEFDRRSGEVSTLNAHDGRVLVDCGKELRVQSLRDRSIEGVLQLHSGAATFTRMALFAPDGKTILTTGTENRLQLWRTPVLDGRGAEIRQFLWTAPSTCGAFSGDGTFVVTGTQDGKVLIWNMPPREEIEKRIPAHIVLVEQTLDSSTLQVRLWAELDEVPAWVVPGSQATIVVALDKPGVKVAGR